MLNTSPQEEISKVTYKARYDLFSAAAADIAQGRKVLRPPLRSKRFKRRACEPGVGCAVT